MSERSMCFYFKKLLFTEKVVLTGNLRTICKKAELPTPPQAGVNLNLIL